ncbi:MAG: ABC transporter ATP-binding protein [Planctomycetota bacterium]
MSTQIQLQSIAKHYPALTGKGETRAVDAVDLTVEPGELFFLLGPSGCGKTTLLRMIAGFIEPTLGAIRFDEQDVTTLTPAKRNTGMVFQSYALWPHMTVAQNVAFGLNIRKVEKKQRDERVAEALQSVRMDHLADRKPGQLSGGQQQRVALARALVVRPQVLLLDEPLSNLDAKLRLEMRSEIRRICKTAGITTLYVTHDQKEALSMADRIAVMDGGQVAQVGPPRDLYAKPATRFVADFLGETNFLDATVHSREGETIHLETPVGNLVSTSFQHEATPDSGGVTCSIRPEAWHFESDNDQISNHNALSGKILDSIYLGEVAQHVVEINSEQPIRVFELHPTEHKRIGTEVQIGVRSEDVVVLNN